MARGACCARRDQALGGGETTSNMQSGGMSEVFDHRSHPEQGRNCGPNQIRPIGGVRRREIWKMVDLHGPELNQFFDILAEWEAILRAENFSFDDAPYSAGDDEISDLEVAS